MQKRLEAILRLAIKYKASDIHFETKFNQTIIELRINDDMYKIKSQRNDNKLIRYLQYKANLDIGHLLKPQTGQFEETVDDNLLSLRFAVINNVNFTSAVLRILNSSLKVDINNLSHIKEQNEYFKSLLEKDYGLVLLSGPTGSGKTTTLYSMLKSKKGLKIYTIEDPIEVYNDEFVQLQVNEAAGFDYSEGIKQILRHDPDVIMIGEIRDEKAAKMAVVAANTGHLVLSTIHASKASSCISRMIELGVNEEHLYEILVSLSNQRMLINKDKTKRVVYEIMDNEEIEYFRNNKKNSKNFINIESQINSLKKEGLLNEN